MKYLTIYNACFANRGHFDRSLINIPFEYQVDNAYVFLEFDDLDVQENLYAGMDYNQEFVKILEKVINNLLNSVLTANDSKILTISKLMGVIKDIGFFVSNLVGPSNKNVILSKDIIDQVILNKEQNVLIELASLIDTVFFFRFNLIKEIYLILTSLQNMQDMKKVQEVLSPIIEIGGSIHMRIYGYTINSLQGLISEIKSKV
ncbi:hypothetical protein BOFE_08710 (plasmid) [Candidatus Borrelia fainii]|uniref:Uncharacterized protein n=1 Tax=Candidatus Borrelia fainii TaxID=2518322 RepID=A0ABM8DL86_9SPIR|nr:hypothetical protein [Candidatus Borrelia fainii]BDU63331.1 hypothetical protein BOFE_08710 [Candidatus Borrelia fainii]